MGVGVEWRFFIGALSKDFFKSITVYKKYNIITLS